MSLKDLKKEYICKVSSELFLEKGIEATTIKDISLKAGLGEATIYRNYESKQNLAIDVALLLQSQILNKYININNDDKGHEQIASFYSVFETIFVEKPEFFRFIAEFDSLFLNKIHNPAYSNGLDNFKDLFISAYHKGVEDGSIKEIDDIETFYFASTHSLLELCKKLSSNVSSLKQDQVSDKQKEISLLVNLFSSALSF